MFGPYIDTLGRSVTLFYKGGNLCDFLFAFLYSNPPLKKTKFYSKRKDFAQKWSKFFPFRVDPFSQMRTMRIHHECPCRIGKSHPRGRNFNQGRGLPSPWIPTPRMRFSYPAWIGFWCFFFLPPLSGLFLGPVWSCNIEVSHMGEKPTSYWQRWVKNQYWQIPPLEVY